jgi:hypothetical protein
MEKLRIVQFNWIFSNANTGLLEHLRSKEKELIFNKCGNKLIGKKREYTLNFYTDNLDVINNFLGLSLTKEDVIRIVNENSNLEQKEVPIVKPKKKKNPVPWNNEEEYFYYIKESSYYDNSSRQKALVKNAQLIDELYDLRENALGIGTRKMKIRLNKIAVQNIEAKIARMVLEIEDVSTQAKNASWKYKDKKYFQKQELIEELVEIYKQTDYDYGIQYEENYNTNAILYFELPNGSQVSFHTNWDEEIHVKKYEKKWDGLVNSTFKKVITFVEEKFINEIVKENERNITGKTG